MGWKKYALVALLLSFAFVQSCEDFLLKKTVSVGFLSGEISYEPSAPSLSGDLNYLICNKQKVPLNEIYLISHERVAIDYISYEGEPVRFEEGLSYGLAIYRIRIPVLQSGAEAKVEVRFRINGPFDSERFHIARENLFMDADKVWIPVPFAETWKFNFSLTVKTPENMLSLLGARLADESLKNGKRIARWESESGNALLSGNIVIAPFQRVHRGNIWFYSFTGAPSDELFQYIHYSLSVLTDQLGEYPYSQQHILSETLMNHDLEEYIDGEFLGNVIRISPQLALAGSVEPESALEDTAVPFVPQNNSWKTFEVMAHELSHAYIGGILRFDEDNLMEQEALTEYTALAILATRDPSVSERFIWNNRFDLLNLSAEKNTDNRIWKYLYGVNCLAAAFHGQYDVYFPFLRTLINKYSHTEISAREILYTASDHNRQNTNSDGTLRSAGMIDLDALRAWTSYSLVNVSLSIEDLAVSNTSAGRQSPEFRHTLLVHSDIPVDATSLLLTIGKDGSRRSNLFHLTNRESTNIPMEPPDAAYLITSGLEPIENNLADNEILLSGTNPTEVIVSNLMLFYRGKQTPDMGVSSTDSNSGVWLSPLRDRELDSPHASNVTIIADRLTEGRKDSYLSAWRSVNGEITAYVLFRFEQTNNRLLFTGVLDPTR